MYRRNPSLKPVKEKFQHLLATLRWIRQDRRRTLLFGLGATVTLVLFLSLVLLWNYYKNSRLDIYGNVDIREVNLGFRVSGRISEVRRDEGDHVQTGEIIARLDTAPYQHQLEQAAAETAVSQATLKNAEIILERNKQLVDSGGISKQNLDDALAARDQAAANLALSQARLAEAQTNLSDTGIVSPSDGVVITRAQEVGAIVQAGTTVLTVSLEKPVWVRAYIDEPDLGKVAPGLPVEILTDSRPGKPYHGQVGYISPQAEFTPKAVETTELRSSLVYRIRVVVTDADAALRQGMPATVRIHLK